MILNVEEIRSALLGLANQYPRLATLITLPERTYEGQESYALLIGIGPRCPAAGVLITSGMHGREWGGPDICIYFAADLLEAYTLGTDLTYGGKTFSASVVRQIVERVHVVVFPCVNPDGVRYSHANRYALWRKNRNPASSVSTNPNSIGVDVCRNFDFLWDYRAAFDPAAIWDGLASDSPGSNQFHGTAAFSEPETKNVRWLLEQFPQIHRYLDLHSFSGFVVYPWGDDENQIRYVSRNFTNSAWNRKRGTLGGPYGEYMLWCDRRDFRKLARAVSDAIAAVGGTVYGPHQLFLMPAFGRATYATSGVSFDWAYSRNLTDRTKRMVRAFGIEFNTTPKFDITYDELVQIVPEVSAGLMRLCESAVPVVSLPPILCRGFGFIREAVIYRIPPASLVEPVRLVGSCPTGSGSGARVHNGAI